MCFTYSKHPKKHLCQVRGCVNLREKERRICGKHRIIQKQTNNPYSYFLGILRRNAKRRGIDFDLSIGDFITFCDRNNYLELKGREHFAYSIDRIRQNEGYHLNNLQILTNEANIEKYWQHYKQLTA